MASKKSAKDQAMAAELKAHNVKRVTMLCPICHQLIAISSSYVHIAFHKI